MQNSRNNVRGTDAYTPEQVESVLNEIGVEVVAETTNDYLCYCPFHGNRFTPSFSVSRTGGAFLCFNASCAASGTLIELVQSVANVGIFPAKRIILKAEEGNKVSFSERMEAVLTKGAKFEPWSPAGQEGAAVVQRMKEELWTNDDALTYLRGRKFTDETIGYFDVGYSAKKDLLAVPMHDPKGEFPVGVVGRSLKDKQFKNSVGLPTSKTLWNFHRAKKVSDVVVLTEASFDAMRVHQAGFPNVVACLGGNFSPFHAEQLGKSFNKIIIMSDFDQKQFYKNCKKCGKLGLNYCLGHNPGRDLGMKVVNSMTGKKIVWASYEPYMIYPHGAKDAGDMSDDEIRQCIANAVNNLTYQQWGLY